METDNSEVHVGRDEARAGSTPGVVRYVLAIGLVLIVVAFAIIVIAGQSNTNGDNSQDDTERAVAEQQAKTQQSPQPQQ